MKLDRESELVPMSELNRRAIRSMAIAVVATFVGLMCLVLAGTALSATLIYSDGTQIELPDNAEIKILVVVPQAQTRANPNEDGCVGYPHNFLDPATAEYDENGMIIDSDPCTFLQANPPITAEQVPSRVDQYFNAIGWESE